MGVLVVITGPIGAGKSTVGAALATRVGARETDLDDLFFATPEAGWRQARIEQAVIVRSWLDAGDDVVVHGDFAAREDRRPIDEIGAPYTLVLLDVPFDVALERVLADITRGISRHPDFLRGTHDAFRQVRGAIPADVTYDTSTTSLEQIVGDLVSRLRASRGTVRDPRS